MRIPSAAHSALEYHRWLGAQRLRPDGLRYARHMRTPIAAPVLQLHGALDTCVLPQTARGAGRYVDGPYRWRVIDGAGHFPHEERPEVLRHRAARLAGRPGTGAVTAGPATATRPGGRATPARATPSAGRWPRDGPGRGRTADPRRPGDHRGRGGARWPTGCSATGARSTRTRSSRRPGSPAPAART